MCGANAGSEVSSSLFFAESMPCEAACVLPSAPGTVVDEVSTANGTVLGDEVGKMSGPKSLSAALFSPWTSGAASFRQSEA